MECCIFTIDSYVRLFGPVDGSTERTLNSELSSYYFEQVNTLRHLKLDSTMFKYVSIVGKGSFGTVLKVFNFQFFRIRDIEILCVYRVKMFNFYLLFTG